MEKTINAFSVLKAVGVDIQNIWVQDNTIFLFAEDWEKVRRYFGWSPAAEAGEYGGWRFEIIPDPKEAAVPCL